MIYRLFLASKVKRFGSVVGAYCYLLWGIFGPGGLGNACGRGWVIGVGVVVDGGYYNVEIWLPHSPPIVL